MQVENMPGDESLSDAELAYFSSGGKDTAGIAPDPAAKPSGESAGGQTQDVTADVATDKNAAPAASDESGEDDGEEVIITDKNGKPRAKDGRFVPHQALHSERERRKGVEVELAKERERATRLDERWRTLEQLAGAPDPKKASAGKMAAEENPYDEADVDPAEDIFKALDQQKRRNAFLLGRMNKREAESTARDTEAQVRSTYVSDAKRLVASQIEKGEVVEVNGQKVATFQHAYGYLVSLRHAQLEAAGMDDKAARDRTIAQEERDLVQAAIQGGKQPAEVIFAFAKASGYKAPSATAPNDAANKENAAKLAAVKSGMSASASLSGAGSGGEQLTAARIADMSEEEFNAWSSKQSKETLRKLMGG